MIGIINKAYRPNAHLFDIIMQLICNYDQIQNFNQMIACSATCISVHNIFKLGLTKKHMNFNMHTVPAITQCMDH